MRVSGTMIVRMAEADSIKHHIWLLLSLLINKTNSNKMKDMFTLESIMMIREWEEGGR